MLITMGCTGSCNDDVIKWNNFSRYWPLVRLIHRSPVNSPQKGQWRGALMFSLICTWTNGWVNNREPNDLRQHRAHNYAIVMVTTVIWHCSKTFSQWGQSFHWKLLCLWPKWVRLRQIALIKRGPIQLQSCHVNHINMSRPNLHSITWHGEYVISATTNNVNENEG